MWCIDNKTYQWARDESVGYCLACHQEMHGIEPDARKVECELCREARVYGIEELLLMRTVDIVDYIPE